MPDKVERDLSRFHHLRYSDRWRYDEAGQPRLTLREIWVRINDLPGNSALAAHFNSGTPRWETSDHLLASIWEALTGRTFPARPKPPVQQAKTAARRRAEAAARARFAQRNRTIAASTKRS
ncbi:hypothetical protein [Nocardia farcinica]|uniref:hypothetical protein n=1 Tax=Nocardia farcinica TaxID=37329 RepID=UPI0018960822|nr:hypothetical protein [Nocardia farcinica]MBF6411199.1 hypothetical protein [Nocardia farcinica]